MSNLQQFIAGWINLRQQRQALLDVLGKPDDHLLRDAGLTMEDASWLASHGLMAWIKSHGHRILTKPAMPRPQALSVTPRSNCYPRC